MLQERSREKEEGQSAGGPRVWSLFLAPNEQGCGAGGPIFWRQTHQEVVRSLHSKKQLQLVVLGTVQLVVLRAEPLDV